MGATRIVADHHLEEDFTGSEIHNRYSSRLSYILSVERASIFIVKSKS